MTVEDWVVVAWVIAGLSVLGACFFIVGNTCYTMGYLKGMEFVERLRRGHG